MATTEQEVAQTTTNILLPVFQLALIVVLVLIAKARRGRVNWSRERAVNIGVLCGIYLALLYFAGWVLGVSPGIGVLAYPFAVYFLALSIYRARDLAAQCSSTAEKKTAPSGIEPLSHNGEERKPETRVAS